MREIPYKDSTPAWVGWLVRTTSLAFFLWACAGCAVLKPVLGAMIGAAPGVALANPPLAIGGAGLGAGGGAYWQHEEDRDKLLEKTEKDNSDLRQQLSDVLADMKANERIKKYNEEIDKNKSEGKPEERKKVPYIDPTPRPEDPDDSWYKKTPIKSLWDWITGGKKK